MVNYWGINWHLPNNDLPLEMVYGPYFERVIPGYTFKQVSLCLFAIKRREIYVGKDFYLDE
jgi:hypothetical protein